MFWKYCSQIWVVISHFGWSIPSTEGRNFYMIFFIIFVVAHCCLISSLLQQYPYSIQMVIVKFTVLNSNENWAITKLVPLVGFWQLPPEISCKHLLYPIHLFEPWPRYVASCRLELSMQSRLPSDCNCRVLHSKVWGLQVCNMSCCVFLT